MSKENAQERLRVRLRGRKGLWTCQVTAAVSRPQPKGPAGQQPRAQAASGLPPTRGASWQVSLLICDPVVFSSGFCFHVCLPLPVPPLLRPPGSRVSNTGISATLTSRVLDLLE